MVKPFTLPAPLKFKSVEFAQKTAAQNEGRIYIHFFPQGLIEEAAIHLTAGQKLNWTVAYHPVTGKATVISREISLKDLRSGQRSQ